MCVCVVGVQQCVQPSRSPGEYLTSFSVPLTHCSHSHELQTPGHTHTHPEEGIVKILKENVFSDLSGQCKMRRYLAAKVVAK